MKSEAPINKDFGIILSSALRYALGRMTYVDCAITRYIIPLLPIRRGD